jgi:hypothetical protein
LRLWFSATFNDLNQLMATAARAANGTPVRNTGNETPKRDHAKKVVTAPASPGGATPTKAKGNAQSDDHDIDMMTAKLGATSLSDGQNQTARGAGGSTFKKPPLKLWEQEIVQGNAEVKRKATIAQMCSSSYSVHRAGLMDDLQTFSIIISPP